MENSKSIVEGGGIPKPDKMKIIKVMRGTSFLNYRKDLEKQGIKVDFATSPFPYYKLTHRKWGKKSDGKERAIYITSKQNVGDDAEYISNDNIAMGELSEIVQESMFNKMKTKAEIKELVKEVITEILAENHNFKVGDEVKFNGDHDGVVVKVHTSGKLKGHIDVQKKGRTSTVTLHGGNKREVRLAENISEETEANINVNALSPTEQQLAVGIINFFGTGSHPMADIKGLKYFKVNYLADIVSKNKSKLKGDVKKHLARILKKLQKSTNEENIKEGMSDLDFVIDQISNSMEHYDEKDFSDLSKETKYNSNSLKKVFNAYWDMGAMERHKMSMNINDTKKFLKKFGIK